MADLATAGSVTCIHGIKKVKWERTPYTNEGWLIGILQAWMYSEVQDKACAVHIHSEQGLGGPKDLHLFSIDGFQCFPLFNPTVRLVC